MGPLGELGALFNPGMRHEIEERQAKANRREEEGNARDGDLRIDLASGVAVINLSNGGNGADRGAAATAPADTDEESVRERSAPEQADDESASEPVAAGAAGGERSPRPTAAPPAEESAAEPAARGSKPLTAAQARRLATAARRSAKGDQPARTATPRPANAQLPSSKASRAAR